MVIPRLVEILLLEFLLYDTQRQSLRNVPSEAIQLVVAVFLGGLLVAPKFTMKFVVRHACDAGLEGALQ